LLNIGLVQNLGGLIFFKYFNFFIDSVNRIFSEADINVNLQLLNIIVPLGISFFTFRLISYLLDIDKGKIIATKDWVIFFVYISFFPTLLSGPIDKAKTFIPQLEKPRIFDYALATAGLRQVLWGLFKKIVIADSCAIVSNQIFNNYHSYNSSTLVLGAFLYSVQIYTDFSGYSDMAIGFSRLIGFNITKNFDFPFFAQNIAEYWRKWHMSLTSWLTEYVFTPLSISLRNYDNLGLIVAIIINFTLCGIWHGPNWTYVLFGFLHGCYFIPLILNGTMNKRKKKLKDRFLPTLKESVSILSTFTLVMLTFVIFRCESIGKAFDYYKCILNPSFFKLPELRPTFLFSLVFVFFIVEWIFRDKEYGFNFERVHVAKPLRFCVYIILSYSILFSYRFHQHSEFIYIQF
jgi:D-alanyl-lipoteichoic acid acyltransferase DltB (MBOAT superfamily)